MKVYVVMLGLYREEFPCAVFTDKKIANELSAQICAEVQNPIEFELDAMPDIPIGIKSYRVIEYEPGKHQTKQVPIPRGGSMTDSAYVNKDGVYPPQATVYAYNEQEATAKAVELWGNLRK